MAIRFNRKSLLALAIASATGVVAFTAPAHADLVAWHGTTSATWATGTNWSTTPNPPQATDVAQFNSATYTNQPNAGTNTIGGIEIDAPSGAVTITGTQLTIGGSGIAMNGGAASTISSPITLGASQTWTNSAAANLTIGAGAITGGGNNLTVTNNGSAAAALAVSGASTGLGNLTVNNNNSGTGAVTMSATMNGTGILTVNDTSTTGAAITLSGAITGFTSATVVNSGTGVITISGAATGLNSLVLDTTNTGIVTLSANSGGTLGTFLKNGTLKAGAAITLSGPVTFGSATSNGKLDLNGQNITVQGLAIDAGVAAGNLVNQIILNNGATTKVLTVDTSAGNRTFAGLVENGTGTVGLTKTGLNTLTLSSGVNTYTGVTSGNRGTLEFVGRAATSTQTVGVLAFTSGGVIYQSTYTGDGVAVNTLAFNGALAAHTAGATADFVLAGSGSTTADNLITASTTTTAVNTIIGPWITFGLGASTQYAVQATGVIGGFTPAAAQQVTTANSFTVGSGALSNYDLTLSSNDTLTAARQANTFRYFGGANTIDTAGNTLTLNGALNDGTGTLTIAANGTGGVVVGSTNELVLNAANADIELTGTFIAESTTTAKTVTLSGASHVLFNQINNTNTGLVTFFNGSPTAGELEIGSSQTLGFAAGNTGGITINNVIINNTAGASGVAVNSTGAGVITFTALNTYTGVTTVDNGVLAISNLGNGGSASGIGASANLASNLILGNGTLRFAGSTNNTTDRLFTIGDLNGNNATLDNSGSSTTGISFTNTGNIVFGTTGQHTLTLAGSQAPGSSLVAPAVFDQGIVDSGAGGAANATSVIKSGASLWTLNGVDSYSGGTTINAGILRSMTATAYGSGPVTVNSVAGVGGLAYLSGVSGTTSYDNDFNISGNGPNGITSGGVGYVTGAIRIDPGVTISSNSTITLTGDSRITAGGAGATALIAAQITGSYALTLGNAGGVTETSITLSNPNNNWTGGLTLVGQNNSLGAGNSGGAKTFLMGAADVIPFGAAAGDVTLNQGGGAVLTVDLKGFSQTFNGMDSLGNGTAVHRVITNSGALTTLNIGAGNASGSFLGNFSGAIIFNKIGTGTQTLQGSVGVTGTTSSISGTLAFDVNQYANGQADQVAASNYFTPNADVTLDGTFALNGRAIGSAATFTGNTNQFSGQIVNIPVAVDLTQFVVGQKISAAASPNNYIQAIDVANRIILMGGNAGQTLTSTNIAITANVGGTTQTFKSLTLSGNSALEADGATPVTINTTSGTITSTGGPQVLTLQGANASNNTLTPNITDGVAGISVVKSGTGVWVLSNAGNTYTGATAITGGTLKLAAASNNIASSSEINVGAAVGDGSVLDVSGVTGGFIVGAQTLTGSSGTVLGNTELGVTSTFLANLSLATPATPTLNFVGNLVLDPPSLNFMGSVDGTDTYVLATYTGTESGTFDLTNLPAGYNINYGTGSNSEITLVPTGVPEPASLALLGVGAAGLLLRRRRR